MPDWWTRTSNNPPKNALVIKKGDNVFCSTAYMDNLTYTSKYPMTAIHPGAKIAENVVIEPFVTIHEDVEIGEGCWIGSHAYIHEGARIGKNVKIFPGAVISMTPQDLKYEGEYTTTEIGDGSIIREYATVHRGTRDRWKTVVGSNVLVMAYCHIAHDCIIGDNVVLANAVNLAGHVVIGDHATIGGMSAAHQFVEIGSHAMVSGGSLIRKDVPPYTKSGREPLTYFGVNSIGMSRKGFTQDAINEVQEIYRVLFNSGLNSSQAVKHLRDSRPAGPYLEEIIRFVEGSERGIIKGTLSANGNA